MITSIKLKKTGGSRFENVDTYKVVCDSPNELEIYSTLKSAEDDGSDDSNFVHVGLARMLRLKRQCVIKVNSSHNIFLDREMKALQLLQNYPHVVQYLCHFTCKDNKQRWKKVLQTSQFACDRNGTSNLTFVVMEYLKDGSIRDLLRNPDLTLEHMQSLFLQTAFILYELGKTYHVSHGDLHTGNVLLKKTKKNTLRFLKNYDHHHDVHVFGYKVVLVDFGRGRIFSHPCETDDILNDIAIVFQTYINNIQDIHQELSSKLMNVINKDFSDTDFFVFMQQIRQCFL